MEDISALKSLESRVRKLGELHDNGVGRSADNDIRREMLSLEGRGGRRWDCLGLFRDN